MSSQWCLVYVITCDNGSTCGSERFVEVGRLFRNHPLVRYSRPYHELVSFSAYDLIAQEPRWQLFHEPRIIIRHYGYEPSEMEGRKKHDRGLRIMESYIKEHQGDDYILTKLGETYSCVGRHNEALDAFRKAVAIDPKSADAHKGLGLAYCEKGMFGEAVIELKQAIAINPKLADVYNNHGLVYCSEDLPGKAISEFMKAIEMEPDFAEARYNLGMAYGAMGLVHEEIPQYKKALDINPNLVEAHCNLGAAYDHNGMWDDAIAEYKKALVIDPRIVVARVNLAVAYRQKGLLDDAISEFRKAMAIDPKNGEVHFHLAAIYYAQKQYGLAVQHCDRAAGLGSQVPPWFMQKLHARR